MIRIPRCELVGLSDVVNQSRLRFFCRRRRRDKIPRVRHCIINVVQICCIAREPPINALRALAAVGGGSDLVKSSTTGYGTYDQWSAGRFSDVTNDLRLGFPKERRNDVKRITDDRY